MAEARIETAIAHPLLFIPRKRDETLEGFPPFLTSSAIISLVFFCEKENVKVGKFNSSQTSLTTNKSGHAAYRMRDKQKLVTQVLTSFFNEKKFYGDNSAEMQETIKKVIAKDPQFVANLAVFARREFNMRSVSHVLVAHLAHEVAGKPYTRKVVKSVALRGDDVTEIMACYLGLFGKPIPNALKKGISDTLRSFDEYTMAKYKGEGKAVKMRDLLCLCHAKPKDAAQAAMWKRLLDGELETPYTWETQLSANGNNAETWEALIDSGKVGYMALLRNLRNILQAQPRNLQRVLDTIENPEAVRRSKQLPFRFLSAYKEVAAIGGSRVLDVLENAVDASVDNLPKLPGTTVIAVDVSGSMGWNLSDRSEFRCIEVAMVLGMTANRICDNAHLVLFNNHVQSVTAPSRAGILTAAVNFCGSGGTDMAAPFRHMEKYNIKADRVIVLSDNECNANGGTVQTVANETRRKTGSDFWVHAIDLQGYGTQQFCGPKTNVIAGWSEKVFDFILLAEQGGGSLEATIAEYEY